jgi:hypothetical protein
MERDISTNPNTRVPCCTGHRTLVSALLVVIVACTLAAVVVGFTER